MAAGPASAAAARAHLRHVLARGRRPLVPEVEIVHRFAAADGQLRGEELLLKVEEESGPPASEPEERARQMQARIPLLIISPDSMGCERRPAVVLLHATGKSKEFMRPQAEARTNAQHYISCHDSVNNCPIYIGHLNIKGPPEGVY